MRKETTIGAKPELKYKASKTRQKFKILLYSSLFKLADKIRPPKTDFNDKNILDALEEKGIVVIPGYYTAEQCSALKNTVEQLLTDYKDRSWTDEVGSDTRLYGTDLVSKEVHQFYADKYLHSIGVAYLNTNLINLTTLANRLKYSPDNLGSGHGWHRDSLYYKQFKAIIYLSDTTEDNGPFEYLIGSHTVESMLKIINETSLDGTNDRLTEEDVNTIAGLEGIERRSFPGKAGTLILVNTLGIHRGKPIRSGYRYALTNYYYQSYQREYLTERWNTKEHVATPLVIHNKYKYAIVNSLFQLKRFFLPSKT